MRYLKRFNEGSLTSTLTTGMVAELRDFCRDHLAYLVDDGFTVQVIPTFYGNECDVFIFKEVKERFTDIITTEWSSIKDQVIPFLYMLNKHYTIVDAEDDVYNRSVQRYVNIQPSMIDNFISDDIHDFKAKKLRIKVDLKDQSITEAIEPDEIKDFCEMYLAYLLDDGYALTFNESGRVTQINFVKPNTDVEHIGYSWMNWDEIKDSFIPFLKVLDKQYDIKDHLIFFQIRAAAQIKMSFQDVIDDKVKEKIFSVTKGYKNHDYDHATVISSITIPVLDHSVCQYSWQLRTNESVKEDELLEFSENHLAYLIDDGFEVMTYDAYIDSRGYGSCTKINISRRSGFTWEEIVDRFSPFIYMLNKQYYILEIVFHQSDGRQYQFDTNKDIEELISGEVTQYLPNRFYNQIRIIVRT